MALGHSRSFMAAVSRATGISSAVLMIHYTRPKRNTVRFMCTGEDGLPVAWASKGHWHLNAPWSHTGAAQRALRRPKAMRCGIGNLPKPGFVVNLV